MARVRFPKIAVDRTPHGNAHGDMKPRVILIHSTEGHDRAGTSDVSGTLKYLEGTPDKLGVHFCIDAEGNIGKGGRCHAPGNLMYHAAGANSLAIGIELVGYASFPLLSWIKRGRQLRALAWLVAWLSQEFDIPLHHSTSHGVAMHKDFPAGGHHDPGRFFPFTRVVRMAGWNVRRASQGKTYGWNTPLNV